MWTPSAEEVEKLLKEETDEERQQREWEASPEYQKFMEANAGRNLMRKEEVVSNDAMEFFRHREGQWKSWRVSHHLAFRRDETGVSEVKMQCLDKDDDRVVQLCKDHNVDPARAQGGCYVTWLATMAWDQEGDNHEGSTTFALVPNEEDPRKGELLRDRGYAEIVPISGTYSIDEDNALNLVTPYDGGEVLERFWFDGPDVVNRLSSVKRFGGFTNATFATERRLSVDTPVHAESADQLFVFGSPIDAENAAPAAAPMRGMYGAAARASYGRNSGFGPPSMRSAFGSPSSKSAFGPPSSRSAFNSDSNPDGEKNSNSPNSNSSK